jgi:hypothetical protein
MGFAVAAKDYAVTSFGDSAEGEKTRFFKLQTGRYQRALRPYISCFFVANAGTSDGCFSLQLDRVGAK